MPHRCLEAVPANLRQDIERLEVGNARCDNTVKKKNTAGDKYKDLAETR